MEILENFPVYLNTQQLYTIFKLYFLGLKASFWAHHRMSLSWRQWNLLMTKLPVQKCSIQNHDGMNNMYFYVAKVIRAEIDIVSIYFVKLKCIRNMPTVYWNEFLWSCQILNIQWKNEDSRWSVSQIQSQNTNKPRWHCINAARKFSVDRPPTTSWTS